VRRLTQVIEACRVNPTLRRHSSRLGVTVRPRPVDVAGFGSTFPLRALCSTPRSPGDIQNHPRDAHSCANSKRRHNRIGCVEAKEQGRESERSEHDCDPTSGPAMGVWVEVDCQHEGGP